MKLTEKDFKLLREGVWSHKFSLDSIHELEIVVKFEELSANISLYNNTQKKRLIESVQGYRQNSTSKNPLKSYLKEINEVYQMTSGAIELIQKYA